MRDRLRDEEITRGEFREEMAGRRAAEVDGMMAYRETLDGILPDEQRSQMRNLQRQANRGRVSDVAARHLGAFELEVKATEDLGPSREGGICAQEGAGGR